MPEIMEIARELVDSGAYDWPDAELIATQIVDEALDEAVEEAAEELFAGNAR